MKIILNTILLTKCSHLYAGVSAGPGPGGQGEGPDGGQLEAVLLSHVVGGTQLEGGPPPALGPDPGTAPLRPHHLRLQLQQVAASHVEGV